ncbi:MAG: hypothetical protein LAP87_15890 [Acidobacteriia bacterium]|nr:hypothetical protein [Terriglobia bacterium]
MSTPLQISANRRNSQKSTGPRSVEGKAAVRFNALKTGIDAQSHIIPGEDPDALAALNAEYHQRFQPANPDERALVDLLVSAEWQLRRFRTVEAHLWTAKIQDAYKTDEDAPLGNVFASSSNTFVRLQRLIDSAQRSYLRTLKELRHAQELSAQAPPDPDPPALSPLPSVLLPAPDPLPNQSPRPQIGFVPDTHPDPAAGPVPLSAAPSVTPPPAPLANAPLFFDLLSAPSMLNSR